MKWQGISRRQFLSLSSLAAGYLLFAPGYLQKARSEQPVASEREDIGLFVLAQLRYRGGDWDPYPQFLVPLLQELEARTSIDALKERRVVSPGEAAFFFSPFVFMAGRYEFEPFSPQDRAILSRFLSLGGFLLAEDSLGQPGYGFDKSFRQEMAKILPGQELKKLPLDHAVYHSFYLLREVAGRTTVTSYLEGITMDNWTPVIYSQNDLAGAWSRDKLGRWLYPVTPGGENQRALAFKTGINIIVYALTGDYKNDLIHHPFIKKRLNP